MTGIYEALPGLILALTALVWQYVHTHGQPPEPPK